MVKLYRESEGGIAMKKKHRVKLSEEERCEVQVLSEGERTPKSIGRRCRVLLLADEMVGKPANHEEIAVRCGVSSATVYNVVRDYHTQGLSYALRRREHKEPPRKRIVTGEQEARIIALACGEVPDGHARWSIRLLQEKVVELEIMESVGRETIRMTLKKRNYSLI